MYKPVGMYSHTTKIPANMDTYVFSGQIGIGKDGRIPTEFNEEVKQTFVNIKQLLEANEINSDNITKVNIWSVNEIDWQLFDEEWGKLFPSDYPSMTIAYISALGLPEIKIEIEIWAVK